MNSYSFHRASIVILTIGILAGFLFMIFAGFAFGVTVWASSAITFFVFQFFSSALRNMEEMCSFMYDGKMQKSGLFTSPIDTEEYSRPIPPAPEIDELQRKEAMDRIKASGFKSTEKFKTANYTIAIDINRHEWAVITPDGHHSDTHKMAEYRRSEINKYGLGVEVLVYFTDSDIQPLHIVLVDGSGHSVMPIKDAEGEARRIVSMLESMEASVKV